MGKQETRDCDEPALAMFRDSVRFVHEPVEKATRQKKVSCPVQIELYAVLL